MDIETSYLKTSARAFLKQYVGEKIAAKALLRFNSKVPVSFETFKNDKLKCLLTYLGISGAAKQLKAKNKAYFGKSPLRIVSSTTPYYKANTQLVTKTFGDGKSITYLAPLPKDSFRSEAAERLGVRINGTYRSVSDIELEFTKVCMILVDRISTDLVQLGLSAHQAKNVAIETLRQLPCSFYVGPFAFSGRDAATLLRSFREDRSEYLKLGIDSPGFSGLLPGPEPTLYTQGAPAIASVPPVSKDVERLKKFHFGDAPPNRPLPKPPVIVIPDEPTEVDNNARIAALEKTTQQLELLQTENSTLKKTIEELNQRLTQKENEYIAQLNSGNQKYDESLKIKEEEIKSLNASIKKLKEEQKSKALKHGKLLEDAQRKLNELQKAKEENTELQRLLTDEKTRANTLAIEKNQYAGKLEANEKFNKERVTKLKEINDQLSKITLEKQNLENEVRLKDEKINYLMEKGRELNQKYNTVYQENIDFTSKGKELWVALQNERQQKQEILEKARQEYDKWYRENSTLALANTEKEKELQVTIAQATIIIEQQKAKIEEQRKWLFNAYEIVQQKDRLIEYLVKLNKLLYEYWKELIVWNNYLIQYTQELQQDNAFLSNKLSDIYKGLQKMYDYLSLFNQNKFFALEQPKLPANIMNTVEQIEYTTDDRNHAQLIGIEWQKNLPPVVFLDANGVIHLDSPEEAKTSVNLQLAHFNTNLSQIVERI